MTLTLDDQGVAHERVEQQTLSVGRCHQQVYSQESLSSFVVNLEKTNPIHPHDSDRIYVREHTDELVYDRVVDPVCHHRLHHLFLRVHVRKAVRQYKENHGLGCTKRRSYVDSIETILRSGPAIGSLGLGVKKKHTMEIPAVAVSQFPSTYFTPKNQPSLVASTKMGL